MLSFFQRDVLDEIWDLIVSVFEGFPTYSYINTLKQELSGTKACEQTSAKEKSVINNHIFQNATGFGVSIDEDQERLRTFYWLPKLHKQTYKARFISNSRSCTTTELSKLLTSCITTIKNHVIKYCEKLYERSG